MENKITVLDGVELTNFVKIAEDFVAQGGDFSQFERKLKKSGDELLQKICSNVLQMMDQQIYNSPDRKAKWEVSKNESKSLLMSFGKCRYSRALFKNKNTGKHSYLLDEYLGIEKHEFATDNAKAVILKEAAETSYRKAGAVITKDEPVTKATVKNYVHELEFPENEYTESDHKKTVKYLYIEADEDHAHLQFNETKGDIEISKSGRKKNGVITKMIYVHEGSYPVGNQKNRNKLCNVKYFTSLANCEDNVELWGRVSNYIAATYNIETIKKIIIQGDGGTWIQEGLNQIPNSMFILDEFHLKQSLKRISRCAFDSYKEVYEALLKCVKNNDRDKFIAVINAVANVQEKESRLNSMRRETEAIVNHWDAAYKRLNVNDEICGCSAEGHISHYLSKRMSRDPLGWSIKGATNMGKLIEANLNGENIVDLVKYKESRNGKDVSSDIKKFMKEFDKTLKTKRVFSPNEIRAKYYNDIQRVTSPGRIRGEWLDEVLMAS